MLITTAIPLLYIIRCNLLHECSASSLDLVLSLCKLSLQLLHSRSIEDIQGSECLSHGLDVGIILRQTVQCIEDEHDTEGRVSGSVIVEGSEELVRVVVDEIELLYE